MKVRSILASTVAAVFVMGAGAVAVAPQAQAAPSTYVSYQYGKVVKWVDGDTAVIKVGSTNRTVRLIGVDTPERGYNGYTTATNWAKRWAPVGSTVKLGNPASVVDKDRYGRWLRYVQRGTVDVGYSQISKGAKARYDGKDGWQWHPRQTKYRALDLKVANYRYGWSKPPVTSTPTVPTQSTSRLPVSGQCTVSPWTIKGNQGSPEWIYHMPGQAYYDRTNAEMCFSTRAAAEAAGYRAAKV